MRRMIVQHGPQIPDSCFRMVAPARGFGGFEQDLRVVCDGRALCEYLVGPQMLTAAGEAKPIFVRRRSDRTGDCWRGSMLSRPGVRQEHRAADGCCCHTRTYCAQQLTAAAQSAQCTKCSCATSFVPERNELCAQLCELVHELIHRAAPCCAVR